MEDEEEDTRHVVSVEGLTAALCMTSDRASKHFSRYQKSSSSTSLLVTECLSLLSLFRIDIESFPLPYASQWPIFAIHVLGSLPRPCTGMPSKQQFYSLENPALLIVHANMLAPAESMASISAWEKGVRLKRAGSSSRSKYWPFSGTTGPSADPDWPPINPRPDGDDCLLDLRGPCC